MKQILHLQWVYLTTLIYTTSAKINDTTKIYPVIVTAGLNKLKEKTLSNLPSPAIDTAANNYSCYKTRTS